MSQNTSNPNSLGTTLGKRINEVRKDRGYTSDQVSEFSNMSPDYLRQIECGKCNKTPSLALFIDICNALQVSPDYLLQDQLTSNEITPIKELENMWKLLPPSKQELAFTMIKAALNYNEDPNEEKENLPADSKKSDT
ncbi:MAG: helix-turn-helix domain-containing protein [Lachnospiraceae bacterium]|nr:helix-turn-helix domain-containing protein [Lachnospiraceae bacterium]